MIFFPIIVFYPFFCLFFCPFSFKPFSFGYWKLKYDMFGQMDDCKKHLYYFDGTPCIHYKKTVLFWIAKFYVMMSWMMSKIVKVDVQKIALLETCQKHQKSHLISEYFSSRYPQRHGSTGYWKFAMCQPPKRHIDTGSQLGNFFIHCLLVMWHANVAM